MDPQTIILSTSSLDLTFQVEHHQLRARSCAANGHSWLHPVVASDLFAIDIDDVRFDATKLPLEVVDISEVTDGIQHAVARYADPLWQLDYQIQVYEDEDSALFETWQVIRNTGVVPLTITRIDSFAWNLPANDYELLYYISDWGKEFESVRTPLADKVILETRYGRSSKGQHPWFALFSSDGHVFSASIAWSGNWIFRFEPLVAGGYRVSGGLHDWNFEKHLLPGAEMVSPSVVMVFGDNLNAISQQYARVGRRYWYGHYAKSTLPVEWNHWFSYEDSAINDVVFRANVDVAADMGMEICVLDAGWFGPDDVNAEWYAYRGDWDKVNQDRFPHGIRALSNYAHDKALKFGLWCEIEGLGKLSRLAQTRPELVATRDGEWLGYLCFGNPSTQKWAYETLSRLISEYNCDWIKLDFNVDPGAGCNRPDHGHGPGDGLYEHYQGYYRILERIRSAYPEVILESCSSGGLRIDLGLMRRTDITFLSDPDWPVHDLQIFWGASSLLAPNACLHWSFCEWRGENRPVQQTFDPRDPNLTQHQLDYYTRISMLGMFGFSQKLPELPVWVSNRLAHHIQIYKDHVRRFVREADLFRLTEQPRRDGRGDRWSAFQYSLPDRSEHLLFVFRLPGAEPVRTIRLMDLQHDRVYRVTAFENETVKTMFGHELMERGVNFKNIPEEGSALLQLK